MKSYIGFQIFHLPLLGETFSDFLANDKSLINAPSHSRTVVVPGWGSGAWHPADVERSILLVASRVVLPVGRHTRGVHSSSIKVVPVAGVPVRHPDIVTELLDTVDRLVRIRAHVLKAENQLVRQLFGQVEVVLAKDTLGTEPKTFYRVFWKITSHFHG